MDRAIVIRPQFPSNRRVIAVSDIHGNLPFFQALMDQIRLSPEDILVLVGDMLEKGQDSLALLRHLMELPRTHTVYPLCGNCDGLVYRFFRGDELDGRFFSFYLPQHPESTLRQLAREGGFDLIILDLMMPKIDGLQACMRIREFSNVPVIMLTAKGEDADKIMGFECGADDYITKPFNILELKARVRALLRRGSGGDFPGANHAVTASGITLDEDAHTASGANGEIDLTPREFELLASLMKNAGKVVSREDLLRDAWGWEYLTETKTVDTHIKRLRDKIEGAGYDPGLVETVRGYGYRFKQ